MNTIAVSGTTGFIGGAVAAQLETSGFAVKPVPRSVARYDDFDAARAALTGVQTLFMVSGRESAERVAEHRTFIDAAVEAGVGNIVYTSFVGASPHATFTLARDHHATEQHLVGSGIGYTFLRDSLYADFLPSMAGDDGVIRGPAENGLVAAVFRTDVARVAATILREPAEHRGATYHLTGPEALSLGEVAAMVSAATGTSLRYENETVEQAYASRAALDAPDWQVDAWVSTYTAIAAGELAEVTDDVERVTGTRAMSLNEYLYS